MRKLLDRTGRKASPETRAKMSATQKALGRLRLGRKHSPETRAKMSATHKARGTCPPAARRTQPT